MTFVHPFLLGGLLLMGLPVLLHLIMRQKPKHLTFPALRFLLQKHRTNQRKLQLRHLLLLALRMLVIAAVCLALARPKIVSERFNWSGERPVAAVLLFDTSNSMEYASAGRSRLEDAKQRGLELLGEMPEGSRVAVLDSAEPGGEWLSSTSLARDRISALELRPANYPITSQLTPAYDLLAKLDQDAENSEEAPVRFLYVFSDRAQSCWNPGQLESLQRMRDRVPPPGVNAVFVDMGIEEPADLAICELKWDKQVIAAHEPVRVKATIHAEGLRCDTEVRCWIDNQEPPDKKPVILEPGQQAVVSFERRGFSQGFHQVRVSLATTDAMPFDNTRYGTFLVQGTRQVLTLTDEVNDAKAWDWAIKSRNGLDSEIKSIHDPAVRSMAPADLAKYKVVCLLNVASPTPDLWEKLGRYVAAGGGLAIIPGDDERERKAYNVDAAQKLLPGTLEGLVDGPQGVHWRAGTYRHPVMAPFKEWAMNDTVDFQKPGLEPAAFRYWSVTAARGENVIVSYDDDKNRPALLEPIFERKSIRGRVLMFTLPLDDRHCLAQGPRRLRWNNYLKDSFYLVLVQKTLGYLAGDSEERKLDFNCGQTVMVPLPSAPLFPTYTLEGPGLSGTEKNVTRGEQQSEVAITQAVLAGNFTLSGPDGKPLASFSLNPPVDESQLAKVPKEQIEALFGEGACLPVDHKTTLKDALQNHWGHPVELLPWLMMLVLLVLAAENLLANKFYRQEKPEGG